ncbi:hypothetical protein PFISCL1PPCAC_23727 [Pristionchus fissidentatus]|uniref:Uncharacterized protein n=1 Tax=Pristionchus fissidentatus TaxID=1538716 RepID=A0AAV5WPH9_9BILA|nr:hypothetical protein PFISCL1PPCAC_23727 [Pristionchus fissidentatus]
MGGCISSEETDVQRFDAARKRRQSSMGVGMGIAMMMQQTGMMMGGTLPLMDASTIQNEIRKAKAEGRTVTVMNGALYIDYHMVTRVPAHYDIHI